MKLDWQENDWFIHQRLVAQMDERLSILKDAPQDITIIGADFDLSHHALHQRYPQAQLTELDERSEYLELSAAERAKKRSMWKKLLGKKTVQVQGSLLQIGTTASADLSGRRATLRTIMRVGCDIQRFRPSRSGSVSR